MRRGDFVVGYLACIVLVFLVVMSMIFCSGSIPT